MTTRDSLSMCLCVVLHSLQQYTMSDAKEWHPVQIDQISLDHDLAK